MLERLAVAPASSQRVLARDVGVALGLANRLLRGLVADGCVVMTAAPGERQQYQLTPGGVAERRRRSEARLARAVERYQAVRQRWAESLARVSASFSSATSKPVMLFGTGAMAEIGFVSLQESDLELRGVFDDCGRGRFFGMPVWSAECLCVDMLRRHGEARLVIATLEHVSLAQDRIAAGAVPADWIFWV